MQGQYHYRRHYVLASELMGLSGMILPENKSFRTALQVRQVGSVTIVQGSGDKPIILNHEDAFWLDEEGFIGKIPGPTNYDNPVCKLVAKTVINPLERVMFTDDAVWLPYHAKAEVLLANGKTAAKTGSVQKGYGLILITTYEGRAIPEIFVRNDGVRNPTTLRYLVDRLQPFRIRTSGLFENAFREQWEPWLKSAAADCTQIAPTRIQAVAPIIHPNMATA